MANRWETMETVTDFIFLSCKITADGECSHEIKRHLIFGRKAMTNLDSMLKSRDITLSKVHLVKSMVFPYLSIESETLILWPPDDCLGKTLMLGKIESRRRGRIHKM